METIEAVKPEPVPQPVPNPPFPGDPPNPGVPSPVPTPIPPTEPQAPPLSPVDAVSIDPDELREKVLEKLRSVFDPEIPVNIYDLGLIYLVDVDANSNVHVKMTLTAPNCPAAGSMPGEVQTKIQGIPGVREANVQVVWEPTWTQAMMSEAARLELGLF